MHIEFAAAAFPLSPLTTLVVTAFYIVRIGRTDGPRQTSSGRTAADDVSATSDHAVTGSVGRSRRPKYDLIGGR